MKHQIITQAADLSVLLRYLSGDYRSSRSTRVFGWCFAAILLGFGASFIQQLWRWTAASGDDRSALIIGVAAATLCATAMLNQVNTSYYFSPSYIERRSPVPFLRRRVAVQNIHEGYLENTGQGYGLQLVPVEGPTLRIPLEGKLRNDFARLYTELGEDPLSSPIMPVRYRRRIYVAILLLFVACVIGAIVLTRRGLPAW
jgi:hypothetical protein